MSASRDGIKMAGPILRAMERKGRALSSDETYLISHLCSRINRQGPRHKRMQEARCSTEMSDKEITRLNGHEARLELTLSKIADQLSTAATIEIRIHFSGDPRGHTIYLELPDATQIPAPRS